MKINDVIKNIEGRFGKETVSGNVEVERISSGCLGLDIALGGGVPKGRIIEFMGWESSGKTTGALHLAAEVQKLGKIVAYIDVEQSLDAFYAEKIGVNIKGEGKDKSFYLCQPSCGEESLEIVREFAKSEDVGLIVIDSVAALTPRAIINGEAGEVKMGLLARMMSSMIPTLISPANNSGCIILFISQYREKIGVMFGDPTTTTGGNALKFYASQRIEFAKFGVEKDGDEVYANKVRVKVKKNKVAPPFTKAEFNIIFGQGYDKLGNVIDLAVEFNIIGKKGSWFSYGETKLGQGFNSVYSILQDNPELLNEITEKIVKQIK